MVAQREPVFTNPADPQQEHRAVAHERAQVIVAADADARPHFLDDAGLVWTVHVHLGQCTDAVPLLGVGVERVVAEHRGGLRHRGVARVE